MKKLLVHFAILSILLHTVSSQAQKRNTKWINIVGGINSPLIIFQNAYGNAEFEYFPTIGLTGGVGVSYFKSTEWAFSGSVLATKNGQNYKGVQSSGDAERKVKLYYIEVPILVMKNLFNLKKPVWLSFGPDIFYLLKATQEYQRSGGDPLPHPEGMAEGDIKERFNPFDVSINLAFSQFYKLHKSEKNMWYISANSSFGLTDINSDDWKTPQTDGSYNGSHNIYLGIKVGLMLYKKSKSNPDSTF